MTPAELIDALKKEAGPNRELDGAILTALCPDALITIYCVGDEEPIVFHAEPRVRNKMPVPKYTDSIDAALTLVPKGYWWSVTSSKSTVDVVCGPDDGSGETFDAEELSLAKAATPALALCISALLARGVVA